jgi:2,3-dihydroxybiphenyl 1,2-dioxygenase
MINSFGYLVVRGSIDEWDKYATEVLGLQIADLAVDGSHRYRMDDRAYRLEVEQGVAGVVALGFEVRNEDELGRVHEQLIGAGFAAQEDEALAERRGVRRLIRSTDPAGMDVEIYLGAQLSEKEFASPRGLKFVAGDLGMGHVFLLAHDAKEMMRYYVEALGFRLSDTIAFDAIEGVFLHCNKRHHSVAFAEVPSEVPAGLSHLMLETTTLDDVGYAFDLAQEYGNVLTHTLGKHTNDYMTSFYLNCPSGFEIEYGWNGRMVDDVNWAVGHHRSTSSWGHKPVA